MNESCWDSINFILSQIFLNINLNPFFCPKKNSLSAFSSKYEPKAAID